MRLDHLLRQYSIEKASREASTLEEAIKTTDFNKMYYFYNMLKRSGQLQDFLDSLSFEETVLFVTALQKSGEIKEAYDYAPNYVNRSQTPLAWGSNPVHKVLDKMGELNLLRRPTQKEMRRCVNKSLKILSKKEREEIFGGVFCVFLSFPPGLSKKTIINDFLLGVGNDIVHIDIEEGAEKLILSYDPETGFWQEDIVADRFDLSDIDLIPGFHIDLLFRDEYEGLEYLDIIIPRWVDPVTGRMIF